MGGKFHAEADLDYSMESETMSTTTQSSLDNQGGRNKDKIQVEKKMKKLRSIKLSRVPSARKGNQFRSKLSRYAASSEQSTPIDMSDASPNHIHATKSENFQVLPTAESGFKILRSVTRKSSMKFRRPQMKKFSGGTELKKKGKKSSRREVNSQDSSTHYLNETSSDMKKEQLQASSCYSGSSFDSSDQDNNISANAIQLAYPGNKPVRVVRTSSLGPMKKLTKMASLRSKRTKKCSSISDPNVERATCSSTLKASKFPDHLEIKPGGNESDGTAVLNVCRYSYCSLHGHHHGDKPLLRRFVSMRRRAAKSQKSLKPDHRQTSGNRKKGAQTEKGVPDGDLGVAFQQTVDIREIPSIPATEGMEGSDFVDLAESVPGESSCPSHEEHLQQSNNPLKVGQQSPGTFQAFKHIDVDCSGIGEQQKAKCDTPGTNIEETRRINNGDRKSIHAPGRPEGGDVTSQEFGDPSQFANLSLKPDDTCNACVPMGKESHKDINDAPVTGMMEEPASTIDKKEDSDLDSGILQPRDRMASTSSTDVARKTEMENQKNFTFWKLIYRHMVTGLDAEPEIQTPRPGTNEEEQVDDLHHTHGKNDSCQEILQEDKATSINDHDASNRKLEFSQSDAIKLVQQAFDKILSEIPDHPSDDQTIVSEKTSEQELLYQKQDEGKENISTSSNSIEECMVQNQEEMKIKGDKEIASEEVKAAPKEGKMSDKQIPSSWSNLKKIIILRRFVKSLEKVRNLKPKTIRYLPTAKDPEAEKIQLRHQTEKERKNAEEWMLDHALRQVISTLAPSQKRKVAMLVQAFETVIPAENGDDVRSNAAASSPTTSVQAYNEFSVDNGAGMPNENGSEISPEKLLQSEMDSTDDRGQVTESNIAYQKLTKSSPDSKETSLLCSSKEQPLSVAGSEMSGTDMNKEDTNAVGENNGNEVSIVDLSLSELEKLRPADKSLTDEDAIRTSHDKSFPVNEEVIPKEKISAHSSEVCNLGSEFDIKEMDLESGDSSNSPDQQPGTPGWPTEIGEGVQPKYKFLHSPLEQPESYFAADISKSERQKYTRLWYLIYKHMVSGGATENGSQRLQSLSDEEVQGDDASKHSRENDTNGHSSFAAGQDMIEKYSPDCNNEIIKLVEEAIDEIPLPEIQQGTSDNQSVIGDVVPDQELPEKKHGQEEVKIISSSAGSAKETSEEAKTIRTELCSTLNSKEKTWSSENVNTKMEAKGGKDEGIKSKKRVQRNWSNLKKLILLRRFVKALEKVREFNPRGPRYLPLDPAAESEKVLLRHQNMGDRKNAEEWMLDYALQQVVAKLTPERKRRVGLLVEAFETVIPAIS
ncbi:hypothetical protein ES332_A09G143500v1 [Gossypium tomentosum]|uniref:Calmodulin-binding domain-containing protein n=1 Tax=Gossypium tomentosum TaxID=34277 RepID=A0A5D2P2Z5_GOSTO|nr:hypothetical protein ES332_A09G143500v1 [Gossypium tomentosum]TYI10478.1 hypothetical protein ES332_A09G143500v1 [Gossypium tomentosum]TYI10479.1 hypothetical protein ES332_A09G143500v1 [Gossypium tomentosum]